MIIMFNYARETRGSPRTFSRRSGTPFTSSARSLLLLTFVQSKGILLPSFSPSPCERSSGGGESGRRPREPTCQGGDVVGRETAGRKERLMASKVKPVPDGFHTVVPYLVVSGAAEAIEFYKKAFG